MPLWVGKFTLLTAVAVVAATVAVVAAVTGTTLSSTAAASVLGSTALIAAGTSIPKSERERYKKEDKARKGRNKKKRQELY